MSHPNAAVATVAGAITTVVVWGLAEWGNTAVPTEVGMALTTIIIGFVLFIGRRGSPS